MRRFSIFAWALAALVLVLPASAWAGPTVVSLTFDDGWANQSAARSMLAAHGMEATFYVNTNTIGAGGFLSWADLEGINAEGHEIAGHTLDHVDLTAVGSVEARRQVCDDRANLLARNFIVKSFAYPYGEYDAATKTIVKECGYASGRGAFGLRNITAPNDSRPYAGPIPPPDPYAVLTPCCIRSDMTLSALQNYVTQAENGGGGWVPLVLHRICSDCGDNPAPSLSPATLAAFLDWLGPRAANGTVVKTVSQVITGDAQPPVSSIACGGTACSAGWYGGPVSVSLSVADSGGSGIAAIRYTTDGSEPTVSSTAYSGPFAVAGTTTVKYRAWDNAGNVEATKAQTVWIDTTAPSSSISCNDSACLSTAYGGSVTVSLSAADSGGSGVAAIRYTTDGSEPTASSTAYSDPFMVSVTTTIKYQAWDNAGNAEATKTQLVAITPPPSDTTPPVSSIACNDTACSGGWYGGPVSVSLSATDDDSGVAVIRYTLDGSEPTSSSTPYTGAFTVSAATTVKYRAWDRAGNAEATKTQLVQIDAVPPSVTITSPTDGATVKGNVKVTANVADADSGIVLVSFYANGTLIGTRTSAPYFVNWNTNKVAAGEYTLVAVAQDRAGNTTTSSPIRVRR